MLLHNEQGVQDVLMLAVGGGNQEALVLKLFVNNVAPAMNLTAADFAEASFSGYASVNLVPGNWTYVPSAGLTPPKITYLEVTFQSDVEQLIQRVYGYFYVGASSGRLRAYQVFDAGPYDIQHKNDKIVFQPEIVGTNIGA